MSYSIDNLVKFIERKGLSVNKIYRESGDCRFILVNPSRGEKDSNSMVIYVYKKYPMKTDGESIVEFTDFTDAKSLASIKREGGEYKKPSLSKYQDNKLYLNPDDADTLLSQYQNIDIDNDKIETLKHHINRYRTQLIRLSVPLSDVKYKMCIISDCCICCINRIGEVECYAIKRSNPLSVDPKNMYITIDLENFYDCVDDIPKDTERVYRHIHSMINETHKKQSDIISSRFKQYGSIAGVISQKYSKRVQYEESIKKLTNVVSKCSKQLKELEHQREKSSSNVFLSSKIDSDYAKITDIYTKSVDTLKDLKQTYTDFLLQFDYCMFDTIRLLNCITQNFVDLGVVELSGYKNV